MGRRFGLVIDLGPFEGAAGPADVARLENALAARFSSVETWSAANDALAALDGLVGSDRLGAVIISGSDASVLDPPAWYGGVCSAIDVLRARQIPTLAVCFGHQMLAQHLGGSVARRDAPRRGLFAVEFRDGDDPLLAPLNRGATLGYTHHDQVTQPPAGTTVLAGSDDCPVEMFRVDDAPLWGIQAHPEYDAAVCRLMPAEYQSAWDPHPDAELDTPAGKRLMAAFAALAQRD